MSQAGRPAEQTRATKMMRACVLYDVGRIEARYMPRPEVGPFDAGVRVSAVGLCGTDFHIFAGNANYNTNRLGVAVPLAEHPQILGHEIAGVVEEVGGQVKDMHPGDRVVLDQGLNCMSARRPRVCQYCASGDSHQCEFYREHGITGLPGGLAEYVTIPAVNAVPIRSDLEMVEAALTEPLGCILHSSDKVAAARARYVIGSKDPQRRVRTVLVAGAGPAGLLFTEYLRNALGYDGSLLVSEPNARKRELASALGAEVIDPQAASLTETVNRITEGRGVEYLIEASGSGSIFALMPALIRKQATVLLYGHGHAGADLSVLGSLLFREPTLVASVGASGGFDPDGRPATYIRALELIEKGRISVAQFITHRYTSFESVPGAFERDHTDPDYVKGVVVF